MTNDTIPAGVVDLATWLPRRRLNIQDAVTNTVTTLFTLEHTSTGTVAANFGLRLLATLEDASGNAPENAGALDFIWADATGASEDCDLVISLKTAGAALAERHRFSSTGVYTPTGGINLNGTNLIGARDVYFDGGGNHNVYGNAALTDATERSLTLNLLNATGDAWVAMITLTPAAAAPTMSFNSRPVSNLTLGGAMDCNSQNMGTAGTMTINGLTLGGAVTGGNNDLNNIDHIGLSNQASSATAIATATETYANVDDCRGFLITVKQARTDAAYAGDLRNYFASFIGTTNNQNWTAATGLRGILAEVGVDLGVTGTITGAAAFMARCTVSATTVSNSYGLYVENPTGAGTVTNAYGIYLENITKGGTLNYAVYAAGGTSMFVSTGFGIGNVAYVWPAADGGAGTQLQTNGALALSWAAAGSLREYKSILGEADPRDALDTILGTKVYRFHYRPEAKVTTGDFATEYVGVTAEEAPWAMHYQGRIVNPVNTLGYMVAGFQAVDEEIRLLKDRIKELESVRYS